MSNGSRHPSSLGTDRAQGLDNVEQGQACAPAPLSLGARDMALRVLRRVEQGEPVQGALDQVLTRHSTQGDPRDSGLCTELVYGYLRSSLRVEAVLASVLKAPQQLPPAVRLALGLAVYSLLFLQRVPDHAVVHGCVELAQRKFGKKMGGLVNAVLRAIQRLGDAPLHKEFYAAKGRTSLEALCLYYAAPLWIGQLWHRAYGAAACEALLQRSFLQPWGSLRLNVRHANTTLLRVSLLEQGGTAIGDYGVAFAPGQTPHAVAGKSLNAWQSEGAFSRQAAGSLAVLDGGLQGASDAPWWSAPVWDACAGQGGKSLALLERDVDVGLCSDTHGGRLRQLRATAQRLGLPCPPLVQMQAHTPALRQWTGTILLDVPCSGLGTLARRPEIRVRQSEAHVHTLVRMQATMLATAWDVLRQGGHVAYMTCTVNPAENEQQIEHLLRTQRAARLVHTWQTPHSHPWMEGMYLAVVQKV